MSWRRERKSCGRSLWIAPCVRVDAGANRLQKFYSQLMLYRKDFGGVLSPKSAWNFLVYGLPTLSTRMINQQKTAHRVARFLQEHPKVARVVYPGLETHPQFDLAKRQMVNYMELKNSVSSFP